MEHTNELKRKLLNEEKHDFKSLCELTEVLRGEGGCPWDREQTHKSIRNDIIEETYEVVEAIDKEDLTLMREELGDVLFQVIFHSEIERERGTFCVDDVIDDICKKMIHRHPHVFGEIKVNGSADVLTNWDKIKNEEKKRGGVKESMMSIPKQLPALMRAVKTTKKARKDGFDFGTDASLIEKLEELCGKLGGVSEEEKQKILTEIIFTSVIIAGNDSDEEKRLSERVDEFIEKYPEK